MLKKVVHLLNLFSTREFKTNVASIFIVKLIINLNYIFQKTKG